jgi:hypothetical protein
MHHEKAVDATTLGEKFVALEDSELEKAKALELEWRKRFSNQGQRQERLVYISGAISGLEKEVYTERFSIMEERLVHFGWKAINPVSMDALSGEQDWETCMRRDICALMSCSHILPIPGWANSRGATIEVYLARDIGLKCLDSETLKEVEFPCL